MLLLLFLGILLRGIPRIAGRTVPIAATRIYEMSFFTGFGVSALIYWSLNYCLPARGSATTFQEVDISADVNNDLGDRLEDDMKKIDVEEVTDSVQPIMA